MVNDPPPKRSLGVRVPLPLPRHSRVTWPANFSLHHFFKFDLSNETIHNTIMWYFYILQSQKELNYFL